MLVLRILLYACETWTILAADERRLEAFHMKYQRQITKIRWQDHIRNSEVAARTGLGPVSDLFTRCRNSVFGHIARLSEGTPAHQALRCHVDLTLGHLPDHSWKRRPGRPRILLPGFPCLSKLTLDRGCYNFAQRKRFSRGFSRLLTEQK